jgi:hypothetical protein
MNDKQALDLVAEILRTPEWSASTIEDVASIVGKVRDIESLNRYEADGTERDGTCTNLVEGVDWDSH